MTVLLRMLSRLFARWPHTALQRLGASLGWVLTHILPVRRRAAADALRHAFPEKTAAERKAILSGMYRHLATTGVECLAYTAPNARDFAANATLEGLDHLQSALAQGHGVLLLMGHIGNWECAGRVLAAEGHPSCVVVRGFRNRRFEDYWREARLRLGVRALNRENSYRTCVRLLRNHEILAMVLDQNARIQQGIFVDFFGRPACTTPGLAHLSARTRAPVVPLHSIRTRDGRHHVRLGKPLPPPPDRRPEAIHAATQAYTLILEEMIRSHPEQWTWGHRRWRTQPYEDASPVEETVTGRPPEPRS